MMDFRIADTFTDSLARLTGDEQKLVKTTAFDLQLNPAQPGMALHRIDGSRDKRFWSVRMSQDLRLIVHRTDASLLLCYVDHHDAAYRWAERRRLETHPKTGAAQFVEVRELVVELPALSPRPDPHVSLSPLEGERAGDRGGAPELGARTWDRGGAPELGSPAKGTARSTGRGAARPPLLARASDEQLLGYGVPAEWLEAVRGADEDSILEIANHLPAEAAEAVLSLAVGVTPQPAATAPAQLTPFEHPDAQRRFRLLRDVEELERALDFPWDKWTVFLHPAQRQLVEADFNGPARVSGSAGTGKTVVALHRAVVLARHNPDARVLLATFSETLANRLRTQLRRLIGSEPKLGEQIEVYAMDAIGRRLYGLQFGPPQIASRDGVRELLARALEEAAEHRFSAQFLLTEWEQVVDAWGLTNWEAYRDVARLGRRTRLPEPQRRALWAIFERVHAALAERGLITGAELFSRIATRLTASGRSPFDFVVMDEAQDIDVPQMRFLAALAGERRNGLFFAGDLGQRIFQQPFSWKALGVDVRGRSRTLRVNYRTSHQIRSQADRLLAPEVADVDGNAESRRGTVSVFNGPEPELLVLARPAEEIEAVGGWLRARAAEDVQPEEMAVFVRSAAELDRAVAAVEEAGLDVDVLDERGEARPGHVSVSTMHLAKGLEFRAVAVMACEDEVIPLQARIESVADDADLEDVYNTERQLLYVACTRARDHLLVTCGRGPSEFLEDLRG